MPTIRISKDAAARLASEFKTLTPQSLRDATRVIRERGSALVTPGDVKNLFSSSFGSERSFRVTQHVLGLSALQRNRSATAEEMATAVVTALSDAQPNQGEEFLDALRAFSLSIFGSDGIYIASKTAEIEAEHQNLYRSSKFITEMRPIFDRERGEIVGSVIFTSFKVDYSTGSSQSKSVVLALDLGDLRRLKDDCEQAIKKVSATDALIAHSLKLRSDVIGED